MIEIGVDVGGTFTDVVCRAAGRPVLAMKVPTTRKDPSRAIISAIRQMAEKWDIPADRITRFVHGTTVATNAVLERQRRRRSASSRRAASATCSRSAARCASRCTTLVLQPETPVFLAPGAMRKEVTRARFGARRRRDRCARRNLGQAAAAAELVEAGARGDRDLLPVLLPQPRARAARCARSSRPLIPSSTCRCPARSTRPSASTSAPSSPRSTPI